MIDFVRYMKNLKIKKNIGGKKIETNIIDNLIK